MNGDCGHCCCDIRANAYHAHATAPNRCSRCLTAEGVANGDLRRADLVPGGAADRSVVTSLSRRQAPSAARAEFRRVLLRAAP
jgi:hypothetical protein